MKAPLVGIFYASPEEGGTPFVQAGDKVEKGTVLGDRGSDEAYE